MDKKAMRELRKKIDTRFKKKLLGRMIFKLKGSKLSIEYMYGGRWCIKKKEEGMNVMILSMTATLDQTVKILLEEKHKSENELLYKLKSR